MIELLFTLFLYAGFIKSHLFTFGIHLPIDFTLLSLFALLIACIKNYKEFSISRFKNLPVLFFLLFLGFAIMSLSYSSSLSYKYDKVMRVILASVSFFIPLLIKSFCFKKFIKIQLYLGGIIAVIFICIFPVFKYHFECSINVPEWVNMKSYAGNYLQMGILSALCVFSILLFIKERSLFLFTLGCFFTYIIFLSGARGSILFYIICILIYATIYRKDVLCFLSIKKMVAYRKYILVLLILVTTIIILTFNVKPIRLASQNSFNRLGMALIEKDTLIDKMVAMTSEEALAKTGVSKQEVIEGYNHNYSMASISLRKYYASQSIKYWTRSFSTFMFGYGIGSFCQEFFNIDKRGYPHNLLLEVAFELGLIGLLISIGIVLSILYYARSFNFFYLTVIFLLLNSLKSGSLTDQKLLFGYLGLMLSYHFQTFTYKKRHLN